MYNNVSIIFYELITPYAGSIFFMFFQTDRNMCTIGKVITLNYDS